MPRGLSDTQASILLYVYTAPPAAQGVAWEPKQACGAKEWTRADSSSFSRSVRRLEQRGLLTRTRIGAGGKRTIALKLTDAGREMVARMAYRERQGGGNAGGV
jgi:DNA-binding MarR family transcriptional regulator